MPGHWCAAQSSAAVACLNDCWLGPGIIRRKRSGPHLHQASAEDQQLWTTSRGSGRLAAKSGEYLSGPFIKPEHAHRLPWAPCVACENRENRRNYPDTAGYKGYGRGASDAYTMPCGSSAPVHCSISDRIALEVSAAKYARSMLST